MVFFLKLSFVVEVSTINLVIAKKNMFFYPLQDHICKIHVLEKCHFLAK